MCGLASIFNGTPLSLKVMLGTESLPCVLAGLATVRGLHLVSCLFAVIGVCKFERKKKHQYGIAALVSKSCYVLAVTCYRSVRLLFLLFVLYLFWPGGGKGTRKSWETPFCLLPPLGGGRESRDLSDVFCRTDEPGLHVRIGNVGLPLLRGSDCQ